MRKILLSSIGIALITTFSSVNAMAEINFTPKVVTPMYIPDENEYVHKTTEYLNKVDWSHESNNPTSIVQSTSYSVQRTKKADFKVKYSETVDAMVAKVGLDIEVTIGTQTSVTESHTWSIPGYSTYILYYGSKLVKESGYENQWRNGKLTSSTYVSGNWSYRSYDDMKRK